MWSHILTFLRDEGNRALLGWVGGGAVVVITGLWAALVYLDCSAALSGMMIGGKVEIHSARKILRALLTSLFAPAWSDGPKTLA